MIYHPPAPPRIIVAGNLFDGSDFSFTTENFDAILNFKDLNAFDVILMIKNFLTYLEDVQDSGILNISIPFLDEVVSGVLDVAAAFKSNVFDKIDFYRPLIEIQSGAEGYMDVDSFYFQSIVRDFYLIDGDATVQATDDASRQTIWFGIDTFQVYSPEQGTFSGSYDSDAGTITITSRNGDAIVDLEPLAMGVAQAAFEAAIAAIDQGVPLGRESREKIAELLIPSGGHTLTAIFSDALIDKYISFTVAGEEQTFKIKAIENGNTLILNDTVSSAVADVSYTIHEKREQIQTLDEFVVAVNNSGLPGVTYDLETQQLRLPIAFAVDLATLELPLDFGFAAGDNFELYTDALAALNASIGLSMDFIIDLDGETLLDGSDGVFSEGSISFASAAGGFTQSHVGQLLQVGDQSYRIVSVEDSNHLSLDRAAAESLQGAAFKIQEAIEEPFVGIDNLEIDGELALTVEDLELGGRIGFVGLAIGGEGSGSGLELTASARLRFDRNPNSEIRMDRRFSFKEIFTGEIFQHLQFDFQGSGFARLKGLSMTSGLTSIPIAPNAEIGIYVQDVLNINNFVIVTQDPAVETDLQALIDAGTIGEADALLVLPDLGDLFKFKDLGFADIVKSIRLGLGVIRGLLEDQPFYNEPLPVINRSLSDVFNFVDEFLSILDGSATPETIQQIEAVLEEAFGIEDDNTLPFHEQKIALELVDGVLNLHIKFEALFSELFGFSLALGSYKSISGTTDAPELSGIDSLTDSLGFGAGG